ncbi:hypothetical protein AB0L40_07030 [Patulibacter sp. NPDC049589]|uniref:hypothetical protein n=1 Tax=Patulibacter sp. NPDC049589 TaxID=3154731 RepID=UPI00341C9309
MRAVAARERAPAGERFRRLRHELGDRFLAVEIDSSKGNPYGNRRIAHSVVTEDLQDVPGHPTREALDRTWTSSPTGSWWGAGDGLRASTPRPRRSARSVAEAGRAGTPS